MQFTPEEMEFVNRTAWPAVPTMPEIVAFVIASANEHRLERTLDYGAGPHAHHTWALRRQGIECHAWDFGRNHNPREHTPGALHLKYHTVMLSSVLNVQRDPQMLGRTLLQARHAVNRSGRLVADFPEHPRTCGVTHPQLVAVLATHFRHVVEIAPGLFECYDQGTALRQARSATAWRVHHGS